MAACAANLQRTSLNFSSFTPPDQRIQTSVVLLLLLLLSLQTDGGLRSKPAGASMLTPPVTTAAAAAVTAEGWPPAQRTCCCQPLAVSHGHPPRQRPGRNSSRRLHLGCVGAAHVWPEGEHRQCQSLP
jgi:hypothetical protein